MIDERRARFDALFATYSRDMVTYCRWRAASPADAQDAVSESFNALRRANPRTAPGFEESVEAAGATVRARLATVGPVTPRTSARRHRGRAPLAAAAVAIAVAVALAVVVVDRWPDGRPGLDDAVAAVKRAATLSAASAERAGTATVRVVHDGALWSGSTIRWNGDDLSVTANTPGRDGKVGSSMLVLDGTVYASDPRLGWIAQGSPSAIDPDSGTTPSGRSPPCARTSVAAPCTESARRWPA